MLKITAVCNAGLLLEYRGYCILIDGTAYNYLGFSGISEDELLRISNGEPPYAALCGVFSTHCHPDHYNSERVEMIKKNHPESIFFTPDEKTSVSGCIQCGPFSVYYHETEHMPHSYEQVRHYVFLIKAGSESIYIAADAKLDSIAHQKILAGTIPSYVAVNPVYLTTEEMISFLRNLNPKSIFVYHVPVDPDDKTGMRRKAERSIARCSATLSPILLADKHPKRLL